MIEVSGTHLETCRPLEFSALCQHKPRSATTAVLGGAAWGEQGLGSSASLAPAEAQLCQALTSRNQSYLNWQ